jgi:hypothetical protein
MVGVGGGWLRAHRFIMMVATSIASSKLVASLSFRRHSSVILMSQSSAIKTAEAETAEGETAEGETAAITPPSQLYEIVVLKSS